MIPNRMLYDSTRRHHGKHRSLLQHIFYSEELLWFGRASHGDVGKEDPGAELCV